jgi:nucleoside phosphorylase
MILFITALKIEADPLIRRYALQRDMNAAAFPVFTGKDVALIISGTGKVNAAMAVTVLAEKYTADRDDTILVNFGFCGSFDESLQPGTPVTLHKITDVDSGRDLYPEICEDEKILSKYAGCFSKVVRTEDFATDRPSFDVCDMESAGIIAAASRYFTTHRVLFFKIVSDLLRPDALDRSLLSSYPDQAMPDLERLLSLRLASCDGGPKEILRQDEALLKAVCEHLGFTVSMSFVLKKDLLSYRARGKDPTDLLSSALQTEVRNKNQAKAALAALRERLHE